MPATRRRSRVNPGRQERSRATLEAIVTAATRIFSAKGYDRTTMNEVAAAAGVSAGSLYQYAPSKAALAAHVMETRSAEILAYLGPRMMALGGLPLGQAVAGAVRVAIEGHRMHARLPNVPFTEAPEDGPLSRLREFERLFGVGVQMYLETHRSELRPQNLGLAAKIATHAVDAAIHAAMAEAEWGQRDHELAEELTALLLGYLAPEADRSRPGQG